MGIGALVGGEHHHPRLETANTILADHHGHLAAVELDQRTDRIDSDALHELIDQGIAEDPVAHSDQLFKRLLRSVELTVARSRVIAQ